MVIKIKISMVSGNTGGSFFLPNAKIIVKNKIIMKMGREF
jgi:hypothetical protein